MADRAADFLLWFAQPLTPRGYTSRYLSAVQAATNTVSTWLQGGGTDEVSSPIAAAAEQLRDEHPFKSGHSQVGACILMEIHWARLCKVPTLDDTVH